MYLSAKCIVFFQCGPSQTNGTGTTLIASIYSDLGCLQLYLTSFCNFNLAYLLERVRRNRKAYIVSCKNRSF